MLKDLNAKAMEVLEEYVRRTPDPEKIVGHNVFRNVGFYVDNKYVDIDARKIIGLPYFSIKLAGLEINFRDGHLNNIDYEGEDMDLFQNIGQLLEDAKSLVTGATEYLPKVNQYAVTSNVVERVVEKKVENPEHKAKAEILDGILNRELQIGRK